MSKRANTTLIGAFVVGAITLLTIAIITFGGDTLFNRSERVVMYFGGSVDGLDVGSPVNVRGVQVGTVTDINIEFNTRTGEIRIPVIADINAASVNEARRLEADDPISTLITDLGLRAQLKIQSILTSQLYIQLDYHPGTPLNLYGDGSMIEIPTIPMPIEQLTRAFNEIPIHQMLRDISSSLSAINRLVNSQEIMDTLVNIQEAAANVNSLTRDLRKDLVPLAGNISSTMHEAEVALTEMQQTLDNLRRITGEDSPYLAGLEQVMQDVSGAAQAISDLQNAPQMQKLDAALDEITLAARRVGTFEDSEQMTNLNSAMEEIIDAARAIRNLADAIDRQPEILLRGRSSTE